MTGLTIGAAARHSGVKVPTIRYYESLGLLAAPPRSGSGRRLFAQADLRRPSFICHGRELGFGVEAIRALLSLQDEPAASCATADAIARTRLAEVEARIDRLELLRAGLRRMLACHSDGSIAACRVIETLADPTHTHGRLAEVSAPEAAVASSAGKRRGRQRSSA